MEEGSYGGQVPGRVVVRGSVLEDEGFGVVGLLDALAVAEVDGRKALEDADQFAIGAFVAGFEAGQTKRNAPFGGELKALSEEVFSDFIDR